MGRSAKNPKATRNNPTMNITRSSSLGGGKEPRKGGYKMHVALQGTYTFERNLTEMNVAMESTASPPKNRSLYNSASFLVQANSSIESGMATLCVCVCVCVCVCEGCMQNVMVCHILYGISV